MLRLFKKKSKSDKKLAFKSNAHRPKKDD